MGGIVGGASIWPHVRAAPAASDPAASASSSCGKPPRPGSEASASPPSARSRARTSSRKGVPCACWLEAARSAPWDRRLRPGPKVCSAARSLGSLRSPRRPRQCAVGTPKAALVTCCPRVLPAQVRDGGEVAGVVLLGLGEQHRLGPRHHHHPLHLPWHPAQPPPRLGRLALAAARALEGRPARGGAGAAARKGRGRRRGRRRGGGVCGGRGGRAPRAAVHATEDAGQRLRVWERRPAAGGRALRRQRGQLGEGGEARRGRRRRHQPPGRREGREGRPLRRRRRGEL